MKAIFKNILTISTSLFLCISVFSQNKPPDNKGIKDQNQKFLNLRMLNNKSTANNEQVVNTIKEIETAISSKDMESLSGHLSAQTYLNLPNGISGYYTSNQAYFVLDDFLKKYRVTSFSFDDINTKSNTPYATGTYHYDLKGNRNSAHIYMQLRNTEKGWRIIQITIN